MNYENLRNHGEYGEVMHILKESKECWSCLNELLFFSGLVGYLIISFKTLLPFWKVLMTFSHLLKTLARSFSTLLVFLSFSWGSWGLIFWGFWKISEGFFMNNFVWWRYAVYHGPAGLQRIAHRIHHSTVVLAEGSAFVIYQQSYKNLEALL